MKSKVITGVMFTFLFIGMLTLAFDIQPVKASGTIYIRPDGSIDPPTAPIQRNGDVYTLTGNIIMDTGADNGIIILRNNMTLDGAGYSLKGDGFYANIGILVLTGRSNLTIKNIKVSGFAEGIELHDSSNNSISGNTIRNKFVGIDLISSNYNSIYENTMSYNDPRGCCIDIRGSSNNNSIYHNNFFHLRAPTYESKNFWDAGYPSGGNYWSLYKSTDLFSGPYQNITGPDGIGDTPYGADRYPLIFRRNSPPSSPISNFFIRSPSVPRVAAEPMTFNATFSLPGWNGTHVRPIIEYRWDFGDGNITSTSSYIIVHTFLLEGIYDVSLMVLDSEGFNSSYSDTVAVWMPTFVSISTTSPCTFVGFAVDITGTLYDVYGKGWEGQTVVIYYSFPGADDWFPITSDVTDQFGNYHVTWIPTATGDFIIKVEWSLSDWSQNEWHLDATSSVSLSIINYQNEHVFSVESNSTISTLAFNATSRELSFTVSGQNGTNGYAKVIIAKSLVGNVADVKVYLDGNQLNYTVTSLDDSWLLHFTYLHSNHTVTISLGNISTPFIETPLGKVVIYGIPITAAIILIALYILKKKKQSKTPVSASRKQDFTANIE